MVYKIFHDSLSLIYNIHLSVSVHWEVQTLTEHIIFVNMKRLQKAAISTQLDEIWNLQEEILEIWWFIVENVKVALSVVVAFGELYLNLLEVTTHIHVYDLLVNRVIIIK